MLAQHGIHIAAHRDFTSGDVVHDSEDFAVDIAADIDTLAGLYLVAAQEQLVIVLILPFPAATFPLRFFPCYWLHRRWFRCGGVLFGRCSCGYFLCGAQCPVLCAPPDGG